MPPLPFQNLTLGLSPELLSQFWQQFFFSPVPNGVACMGVASDCAVVYQLTSAQLLALNATAVQLVAPPVLATTGSGLPSYLIPPGGFLYVPTTMTLQGVPGATPYTIGNANNLLQVEYTGQSTSLIGVLATGILDQAVKKTATNLSAATGPILTNTTAANLGLEVKLTGTAPALTLGNGTAVISLLYNVYALF